MTEVSRTHIQPRLWAYIPYTHLKGYNFNENSQRNGSWKIAGSGLLTQSQKSERTYPFYEEKLEKHCSLALTQDMETSGSPVGRKRQS